MATSVGERICQRCGVPIINPAYYNGNGGPYHERCASAPRRIPHRCPLCAGSGAGSLRPIDSPNGEWTTQCRGCSGAGIVWEPGA